jgi:hypothetical protein
MIPSEKPEFPPLLQVGLHQMTLEELRKLCVGRFPHSTIREEIMIGLEKTIGELEQSGIEGDLWIDGSFLTECVNPADVDVVLRISSDFHQRATAEQNEKLKWFDSTAPKKKYRCDSYKWVDYPEGHQLYWESEWDRAYWIRQYGWTRDLDYKGIAVVRVGGGK